MKYFLLLIIWLSCIQYSYLQTYTISGFIKDSTTNESIIGATIYEPSQSAGTTSNEYGFYSITFKKTDTITLILNYLGYQPKLRKIGVNKSERIDFLLQPTIQELQEIIINASKNDDNVQRAQMGFVNVPMKAIMSLPAFAGERDILKVIQFLPGVQSGQEGTTGYFVRGGNLDQNLVQLDEAVVYNPNHLFGLFSTFNVNAINHVKLIKGGFPAEFGGRLSSILDIQMKEGDNQRFQLAGGLGLLTKNLTLQGPIQKNKSSFIFSARQSHVNALLKSVTGQTSSYRFYDINAKMNYSLGKRDRIYFSFFSGQDDATYSAVNSLKYSTDFGNTTSTLRWNHVYGNKIFSNTSLIYNDYHLSLNTEQNSYYSALYTGIRDLTFKSDITYIPNTHHLIKMGLHYSNHSIYPAAFSASVPRKNNRIVINKDSVRLYNSNEWALYFSDEYRVSEKLSLQYGFRIPSFLIKNKTYTYFEPRFTTKFSLSSTASIKASFTRMNQFLHLIPNATAGFPTDIWLPSSTKTKPQNSSQIAIGLFKNFLQNDYETSIEVYYKKMNHQALFEEGNQLRINKNLDSSLTYGEGESYGAEFFIKKNSGRFTGWASYTLSWSNQTFKELNYENVFPFKYDRRHVLSLTGNYLLSKSWDLSGAFSFSSGAPYTLPTGRVAAIQAGSIFEGNYYIYEARNNYRMNAYHRLDLAANYHKHKKIFKKPVEIEWSFGLYNTYSRLNPYFVYLTLDPQTNKPIAKQVSLLPIIPSINFNFKF